jgi:hypothetical protein
VILLAIWDVKVFLFTFDGYRGREGIKMFSIILLLLDNWRLVPYITYPL